MALVVTKMESKIIINKSMQIIFIFLMVLSLTSIVSADKIDGKNELILKKVLELDNITINNVEISNNNIFVTIEVSEAMDYDTELIAYWGSIFGISAMLKNDNESYSTVTIENLIDGEPYVYVSTNVITIQDYQNDLLEDYEFWEESLVTSEKPSTKDIIDGANLPSESLREDASSNNSFSIIKLWWIIILILVFLFYLVYKKQSKKGSISLDVKTKRARVKKNINVVRKKIGVAYAGKGKELVLKTKKSISSKSKRIASKTKDFAKKTNKKSVKLYKKTKKETSKKLHQLRKGGKAKKK